MIKNISLKNFTVFRDLSVDFVYGLNVIVGENGVGKSHLLKVGYVAAAVSAEWENSRGDSPQPSKADLQRALAENLKGVFRPDSLGRLARRGSGRQKADVNISFHEWRQATIGFSFATNSKTDVKLTRTPVRGAQEKALFLPTKEAISMFPNFASLYQDYHIEIDQTYYDLCLALARPLLRGRRYEHISNLLTKLEGAVGGSINKINGRFVLSIPGEGNMEIPLVAEGVRKLATVAYLVANGTLQNHATLFWDEPETNLNPKLILALAEILVLIVSQGVQVVIATHSLFLLKAIDYQLRKNPTIPSTFISLAVRAGATDVTAESGTNLEDVEPIAALDAELELGDSLSELEAQ